MHKSMILQMLIKTLKKAYKLSPGNKLYSVMYLITANKISADIPENKELFWIKI